MRVTSDLGTTLTFLTWVHATPCKARTESLARVPYDTARHQQPYLEVHVIHVAVYGDVASSTVSLNGDFSRSIFVL